MYATDFEYDGKLLSEFGFTICAFDANNGINNADVGSEISFLVSPVGIGKRYSVNGTTYEKCLSTSFRICKNPDYFRREGEMEITADEFRLLSRWLNRREYLWFHAFDRCMPEHERPWFRASFVLTRLDIDGTTYGIELAMATDSPFGYGREIRKVLEFENAGDTITIPDMNDEIGECYPETSITCLDDGTLTIENSMTGLECVIENCSSGEVISMSGDTMIISSSDDEHDIANDFNYEYFNIGNTYTDRQNEITASMPCTIEIRYRPIFKDTL